MTDKANLRRETLKEIRSLLISAPRGLSVHEMINDYRTFMGKKLPFRELGYNSAEEFFSDCKDVAQPTWERGVLVLRGIPDKNTLHIQKLVSKQRVTKKPPRREPIRRPPRIITAPRPEPVVPPFLRMQIKQLLDDQPTPIMSSSFATLFRKRFGHTIDCFQYDFPSLATLLNSIPDVLTLEPQRGGGFQIFPAKRSNRPSPEGSYARDLSKSPGSVSVGSRSRISSGGSPPNMRDDIISDDLKKKVKEILREKPKGMWAARLAFEFKQATRSELPWKRLGYNSVIELMCDMPDVVTFERPTQGGDWLLFDATLKEEIRKTQAEPQGRSGGRVLEVSTSTAPKLDATLQESVRQVLQAHPEGILLHDFTSVFQDLTGRDLPTNQLGFATLEALLISLSGVVDMVYKGKGRVMLYASRTEVAVRTDLLKNICFGPKGKKGVPSDAIGPGIVYHQIPISELQVHQYIEVYVSNINNPGRLWVQLKGPRTTEAMEILMDRLEETYYSDDAEEYKMPDSLIMIGQVCVAIYPEDDNWHRVTITGLPDMNFVEVFFADYGNSLCVPRTSLRMLKSRFLKLPAQAIPARLANIKPANKAKSWSKESKTCLLSLCSNKLLVALITSNQDGVLSICLCDTSGSEDLHINDFLCEEGLAMFAPDSGTAFLPGEAESQDRTETERPDDINVHDEEPSDSLPVNPTSEEEQPPPEPRCTKYVQLTEQYSFHILLIQEEAYIVSGEISAFFWDSDLLRSMLRQRQMNPTKLVIAAEDYRDIFEDFHRYEVLGTCIENQPKSHVTVYQLKCLPEILSVFGHESNELMQAVKRQVAVFNPQDRYWQGVDEEEDERANDEEEEKEVEENVSSESEVELGLEDLQVTVQALQFKRQRLLQDMINDVDTTNFVDQLNQVELQIQKIKDRIKSIESMDKGKGGKRDHRRQSAEAHKVVHEPEDSAKVPVTSPEDRKPEESAKTNRVAPMPTGVGSLGLPPQPDLAALLSMASQPLAADQQRLLLQQYQSLLLNQAAMMQSGLLAYQSSPLLYQYQPALLGNPLLQQAPAAATAATATTAAAAAAFLGNPGQNLDLLSQMASLNVGAPAAMGLGQGRGHNRGGAGNLPTPGGLNQFNQWPPQQ